jgi:hypothetical protein
MALPPSSPQQQENMMEKYLKLLESREIEALRLTQERDTWLEEKEYNTLLRLAIGNIPLEEKKSDPMNRAIRKAKRLASKTPTKKRERDLSDTTPKPKRKYVRRKLTASDQEEKKPTLTKRDRTSDSTSSSSITEEGDGTTSSDDAFVSVGDGDLDDDTRLFIHRTIGSMKVSPLSPPKAKSSSCIIADTFL